MMMLYTPKRHYSWDFLRKEGQAQASPNGKSKVGPVTLACTVAESRAEERVWALQLGFVWFEPPFGTTRRGVQVFLSAFLLNFAPNVDQKEKKKEWVL